MKQSCVANLDAGQLFNSGWLFRPSGSGEPHPPRRTYGDDAE